jgi:hypothetical protein
MLLKVEMVRSTIRTLAMVFVISYKFANIVKMSWDIAIE